MAAFSYRAVRRDGKAVEGVIEAEGQELASRQLRAQGLTLLKLEQGGSAAASGRDAGKPPGRQAVLSMTSELAVLLRAGLPLDRALKVLIDMAAEPSLHNLLNDLLAAVKGGKPLSDALAQHERVFGGFYINMVRSGEASGQLSAVLDRLVEYLENARANRDSVMSALIYPSILAVVASLAIALMLGFVVPQFESLFEDMGDALPVLTRMVLDVSEVIKAWWWLLALLLFGGVLAFRNWSSTEQGRLSLDRRMLGLPFAGPIVFEFEVAKFARTTGTLLGNGVSLLKAISIAIETVDNRVLRQSLQVLPPAVKAGKRMSVALDETGMFTPMVVQMVRVGEESGSLDKMMLELADVFDQHVQSGIKRGLALLEPVLILSMGLIIAIIMIAILTGILSVNNLAM
ncbi:type II secretion system F family protein [Haliea sp. E17]|uniref:type II secretion system F family protein n=1 Tax=Haliea sp. E17 TaxID=3401576 RepID=UPI003AAE781C